MKFKIKILIIIALLLTFIPNIVYANEVEPSYTITPSTDELFIGDKFDITISLTNYQNLSDIEGIQIDITDIDSKVEIVGSTKIEDSSATTNEEKKESNNYTYLYVSGVNSILDRNASEILKLKLKIHDTSDGNISLPIKIYTSTSDGNYTMTNSLEMDYKLKIINVDITWGDMLFEFDDGTWNTSTHVWDGRGWKPTSENANKIKLTNNGNVNINPIFTYQSYNDYEGLTGEFSTNDLLRPNTSSDYLFNLKGETETRWTEKRKTGQITITIK